MNTHDDDGYVGKLLMKSIDIHKKRTGINQTNEKSLVNFNSCTQKE
jgi:hypothetical protein